MKRRHSQLALAVLALIGFVTTVHGQTLAGKAGSAAGDGWQSSWLDLKPALSFKKAEVLRIRLDGDAENVLVRLLPENSDPTSPDGIEGGSRKVPADHVVVVTLSSDHPNVKQISVHAGHVAFDIPLGPNNGKTRIVSIVRGKQ